ncbi:hypothetical protein [Paraburkholderia haematera]|uniref:hypothetical protein n=1 Tax=Paraburkholderia haematera TaxID=2793077 RepID=UPI001B8DA799|nr:hypothetical protein [Paraburkholderia haematera]
MAGFAVGIGVTQGVSLAAEAAEEHAASIALVAILRISIVIFLPVFFIIERGAVLNAESLQSPIRSQKSAAAVHLPPLKH